MSAFPNAGIFADPRAIAREFPFTGPDIEIYVIRRLVSTQ
jgi:hypothetical protein